MNTKHSAKAQGTRGRKPEKAKDDGGADRRRTKKKKQGKPKAPSGGDKNCETQKGGWGAATTREQPTAKRDTQTRRELTESQQN